MRNFNKQPKPLLQRPVSTLNISGSSTANIHTALCHPLIFHPPTLTDVQAIPASTLTRIPALNLGRREKARRGTDWQRRIQLASSLPWGWLTLGMGLGSCAMFFAMVAS